MESGASWDDTIKTQVGVATLLRDKLNAYTAGFASFATGTQDGASANDLLTSINVAIDAATAAGAKNLLVVRCDDSEDDNKVTVKVSASTLHVYVLHVRIVEDLSKDDYKKVFSITSAALDNEVKAKTIDCWQTKAYDPSTATPVASSRIMDDLRKLIPK
jgi:hypothetical protein